MSNRNAAMQCIAKNPSITIDELVEVIGKERQKVQWTINDCKADALIEVVRDDVTGKPAYRITPKGKAWLVNRTTNGETTTPEDQQQASQHEAEVKAKEAQLSAIISFCEWLRKATKSKRVPMNLEECKGIISASMAPIPAPMKTANPLGYIALPGVPAYENEQDAVAAAERLAAETGNATICAVIAEAKAEIVWKRSA